MCGRSNGKYADRFGENRSCGCAVRAGEIFSWDLLLNLDTGSWIFLQYASERKWTMKNRARKRLLLAGYKLGFLAGLRNHRPVTALKGVLRRPTSPVTVSEMNRAIAMWGADATH